ncbi:uncharacterized protein LOC143581047 [Bidens hawaiensis]|uniref:uncharacterized protein LOC143581047 n=1 Tax=Bidens hawaiensis TaxID=980011 RepID=UPI00404B4EDF
MADPPSSKTHNPSPPSAPTKGKFFFTNYIFSKSIMIILVLLLSYFPSQVPDFFKETVIINKLWDLIYLLVIGIAVSYGLFSRKADRVHSSDDDNIGGNDTYLSGISHISSVFEDANSYGFVEKSWVEGKGSNSRVSEFEGDKKLNQYYLGESLVVINDKKFVLEQLGSKKKSSKPNLGSKSWDFGTGKSVVEDSDSDSGIWFQENQIEKFRGLLPIKLEERFQESGSDFDADSDSRTRFNRRSKSMKLEKRDEARDLDFDGVNSQPVRFKNFSGKEDSRGVEVNYGYRKPYLNSEASSFMESKHQDFDGAFDNGFEDFMKNFGKIKDDDVTFDPNINKQFVKSKSQSYSTGASFDTNLANNYKKGKSVRTNRSKEQVLEPNVNTFQSQTDEVRSVRINRSKEQVLESNANTFQGQTDEGKPVRTNRSKEQVFEPKVNTFQSQTDDGKPIRTSRLKEQVLEPKVNTFLGQADEGKSVRTNRSKEQVLEPKFSTFQSQPDEGKPIRTSRLKEHVHEPKVNTFLGQTDVGKSTRANRSKEQALEPKFSTFQSQTDEGKPVRTNRSKEQVLESKGNTFQSQTDVKAETSSKPGIEEMNAADELSDTELHSGEVDRKAEEFIAKFREQIRLQKVASARKLNMMDYT